MDYASIKPIFEKANVRSALLIDDAFDPEPELDEDALQKGFQLLEADDSLGDAFREAGGAWPADYAAFSDTVRKLQPLRSVLTTTLGGDRKAPLYKLANAVLGPTHRTHLDKRVPLDALAAVLEQVDIKPRRLGSKEKPGQKKYPLIFLDYYLGEEGAPSVDASIQRIKNILSAYGADEMPIVVLMSSLDQKPETSEEFRKKADLLGCQFVFVHKDRFTAAAFELVSSLADRAGSLAQTRAISEFVKAWKDGLTGAVRSFSEQIASIDLQDVYFIWKKAGEGKNNRFGEHLSGLFDSLLRKEIEDDPNLRRAIDTMSGITFEKLPPSPMIPSPVVARIAHASAFRDLEPFPEEYASPPQPLGIDLGELFIASFGRGKKRKRAALMVISQACDLEHGNAATVLMIEGTISERTASTRPSKSEPHKRLSIDIFQFRNDKDELEDLIIEWDAQRMRAFPASELHATLRRERFERVGRLRPVHALAMQQKFASQLTRVGMPDGLPVYRYAGLELMLPDVAGKPRAILTIPPEQRPACIVGDEKKNVISQAWALERIRATLAAADPDGFQSGTVEALRMEMSDIEKFRRLLQVGLDKDQKTLGPVLVKDSDGRLDDTFQLPTKVSAVINLFA